jgi:hypothetical protein
MASDLDAARLIHGSIAVSNSAKIVQRLLAHAKLCREVASASWNHTSAQKLEEMAAECERSAAAATVSGPCGPLH